MIPMVQITKNLNVAHISHTCVWHVQKHKTRMAQIMCVHACKNAPHTHT